ncbi:hypothetical protein, partial [Xanthomonas oryzae]|uniref:hypothetical protein n=1 Tax=Xanthomonas oryzae TaxID=347 RepID=UPI001C4D4811
SGFYKREDIFFAESKNTSYPYDSTTYFYNENFDLLGTAPNYSPDLARVYIQNGGISAVGNTFMVGQKGVEMYNIITGQRTYFPFPTALDIYPYDNMGEAHLTADGMLVVNFSRDDKEDSDYTRYYSYIIKTDNPSGTPHATESMLWSSNAPSLSDFTLSYKMQTNPRSFDRLEVSDRASGFGFRVQDGLNMYRV